MLKLARLKLRNVQPKIWSATAEINTDRWTLEDFIWSSHIRSRTLQGVVKLQNDFKISELCCQHRNIHSVAQLLQEHDLVKGLRGASGRGGCLQKHGFSMFFLNITHRRCAAWSIAGRTFVCPLFALKSEGEKKSVSQHVLWWKYHQIMEMFLHCILNFFVYNHTWLQSSLQNWKQHLLALLVFTSLPSDSL